MGPLPEWLGYTVVIVGGSLFIFVGVMVARVIWPFLLDARLSGTALHIVVLRIIVVLSFDTSKFLDVSVQRIFAVWLNPFRTFRITNRFNGDYVLIERRGLFKYIRLTPKNPEAFAAELRHVMTLSK